MKVRVRKVTIPGDPLLWRVDIPKFSAYQYYRTWPEAIEAALTLWEKFNCQIAS